MKGYKKGSLLFPSVSLIQLRPERSITDTTAEQMALLKVSTTKPKC